MKTKIFLLVTIIVVTTSISAFLLNKIDRQKDRFHYIYQAENSKLNGVRVADDKRGYTGNGFITNFNHPKDSVNFLVNVPKRGKYVLIIRYLVPLGHGDKRTSILINGKSYGEIALLQSNHFAETSGNIVFLKNGNNSIKVISDWGYYDIDRIELRPTNYRDIHPVSSKLINTYATKKTKSLMKYLTKEYGKSIISGQENISYVDDIYKITGKKPAIVGFDFLNYTSSRKAHGYHSNDVEDAIKWNKEGGIVEFQWHWSAPKDLLDWNKGFYTKYTNFDISYALDHQNSQNYRLIIQDIDTIAYQLKVLQDAGVPVLFRPLHEAEEGWFWWGAHGPEPAIKLYRLMYDRITYYHKINNVIWIWNSSSPSWYPGNDYVDIVSYDSYPSGDNYESMLNHYEQLVLLTNNQKLVTMSENGSIPDPKKIFEDHASWSWFLTWGNFVKTNNSLEHLRKVYDSSDVITLDKLPYYIK